MLRQEILKRSIGVIIIISVTLIAASTTFANSLQPVDIVTGEWKPYTSNGLTNKGIAGEIVKAVLNDAGYTPNITFLPFYLGYEKTLNGDFIGTYPYFYTQKRAEDFYFSSQPLFKVSTQFYYNKSDTKLKERNTLAEPLTINELKDYCIGFIQGYDYGNIEEMLVEEGKYRRYSTELNAFSALVDGSSAGELDTGVTEDTCGRGTKLQALPSASQVGNAILDENFRDERYLIGELEVELEEKDRNKSVYFITKKNSAGKELIEQFNASLEKLIANDFIATIESSYQSSSSTESSGFVRLTGTDGIPLVVGYEGINAESDCASERTGFNWGRAREQTLYKENCGYLIPKGTRALVVEWGEPFIKPGKVEIFEQLLKPSRVKILEGPLKDEELYVSNVYIEFE